MINKKYIFYMFFLILIPFILLFPKIIKKNNIVYIKLGANTKSSHCVGLGNQLFKVFAGISYALDHNYDYLLVNCINIQKTNNPTSFRVTYFDNIFKNLNDKVSFDEYDNSFVILKEKSFEYNKLEKKDGKIWFQGYYQTPKYFIHNYDEIIKIIGIKNMQNDIKNKYKYDYNNLCSLHFRIGDFKKILDRFHILDKEYYLRATKKIIELNGLNNFLVFYEKEDEINIKKILLYLKINNEKINQFYLIDTNIPDYEQLLIMSNCNCNIIANSSFSWWGAYLNQNNQKNIIYPNKWFGPGNNHKNLIDMFPNNWISL